MGWLLCKIYLAFFVAFCNLLVRGTPFLPSYICPAEEALDTKSFHHHKNLIEKQETQLKTLEYLVEQLRESVSRLETTCSESCSALNPDLRSGGHGAKNLNIHKSHVFNVEGTGNQGGFDEQGSKMGGDKHKGGHSITKYKPTWQESFQFLSAVKLDSTVTCINVLPLDDREGISKYVAVGDDKGMVYILLTNGDVVAEFNTTSRAYVTSMLSYMQFQRNEGFLVTGHSDGSILMHRIWEGRKEGGRADGEDWPFPSVQHLRTLTRPGDGDSGNSAADEESAVVLLEVHQIGRIRYILGSDEKGRIKVFRENGSLYGVAMPSNRPLAFFRQRLLFLTGNGAGSLDLRNMVIRESKCDGINGSLVTNYAFDVSERSKAYGFTAEGDLVQVVILGDVLNFKCRVRLKKTSAIGETRAVHAIKGYLLALDSQKVSVYNISSQVYTKTGNLRPIFSAQVREILSSFSTSQLSLGDVGRLSVTGNRERLVVLILGSGYVAIYGSKLPVVNAELSTVLWAGPIMLFLLFLVAVWKFFGKKKESLTLWGSDDTFTTGSTVTSLVAGGVADNTYEKAARTEMRELRDPFIGQSRRYGAPPAQYRPGHNTNPVGNGILFRGSSLDPPFRSTSELSYRAPKVEATDFHQRREPLFANNHVVGETLR